MTIEFALAPEHQAELDRIREEHRADPPSGRVPSKPYRYDRFVPPDTGQATATLRALRANPMANDDAAPKPDWARPQIDHAEKLRVFAAAVAAKFAAGDRVTASAAASAAGVAESVAVDCIGRLRARGEWPYERGARGPGGLRRAAAEPARTTVTPKPRAAIPSVERLDLSGEVGLRPAPGLAKSVEPPPAPKPPVSPAAVDLAAMAARLREAADLIERAAALIGAGS